MATTLKLPEDTQDGGGVSRTESNRPKSGSKDRKKYARPETLNSGRFEVSKKVGEGAFGMVYIGYDNKTQQKVAIKLEPQSSSSGQLRNESILMETLAHPKKRQGFAEVFHFGRENSWAILVMDLLRMSLDDSVHVCRGRFNSSTAAVVAEQGIHLLSYLHSRGVVHRDIKCENFMWGMKSKAHHLYIIDFGMSSRYYNKKHAAFQTGKELTGTPRYASINAMKGYSQSRRDDLEAFGHCLVYSLRGSLPWSGLDAPNFEEKLKLICKTKESLPLEELCKGMPEEFQSFLNYSRKLEFDQRPDYKWAVDLFTNYRAQQDPPVKDHDLQFLAGVDPTTLVPLEHNELDVQPDDVAAGAGAQE